MNSTVETPPQQPELLPAGWRLLRFTVAAPDATYVLHPVLTSRDIAKQNAEKKRQREGHDDLNDKDASASPPEDGAPSTATKKKQRKEKAQTNKRKSKGRREGAQGESQGEAAERNTVVADAPHAADAKTSRENKKAREGAKEAWAPMKVLVDDPRVPVFRYKPVRL